jgi:hypothetical protein
MTRLAASLPLRNFLNSVRQFQGPRDSIALGMEYYEPYSYALQN